MKKIFLTLILTIGLFSIFTSCTKKQTSKIDRLNSEEFNLSYQALSSIKMLEAKQEFSNVTNLSGSTKEEVAESEVIEKYLSLMQELLNDSGGFKTETKASDKPEYSFLIEITSRNLQNELVVYSLYYNETKTQSKTEIDEDDLTEETETIKTIKGIALVNNKEYALEGIIEEEKESDEIETESTFKIIEDSDNYVIVEEEVETETNEYEHKYSYVVVSNGKKVHKVEFELEEEDGELFIELKEVSKDAKTSYKFKVRKESTIRYILVEVKKGSTITKIKVRQILDTETNTYIYDYKYIENKEKNSSK